MLPLQMPGGIEILVVLLVLLVPVAGLAGLAYLLVVLVRRSPANEPSQRVEELERRVTELEAELDRSRDSPESEDDSHQH